MTSIRPARAVDRDAIRAVAEAAFGADSPAHGAAVAGLLDLLESGATRVSLVAEEDGSVVGHTMLSRGWVDAARELVEVLVLSPLSVAPDHQRQGIGSKLVRAALETAESLDAVGVFLEGDPAYYARFGFVAASTHGFASPSARIPDAGCQVVVLPAWQSWMTGALVYPEAFWIADCVGLR